MHFEVRRVLATLQPPDVQYDRRAQAFQPFLEGRPVSIGIESHEAQFAPPRHEDVVVPRLLVVFLVASMPPFIRLDTEQCVAHDASMVDPPAMAAVTVRRVKRAVVHEVGEVAVDV
jgi:hypothetical protein